ncbi:MAG: LytTR family transcriptional regulator, partial [Chitinophagaceae bacterium]|nr:LytTR family transcriptional regulator [Chitinophagaceae bacterium]
RAIAITKFVQEHQAHENIQPSAEAENNDTFTEEPQAEEDEKKLITITGDNKREELTVEPESIILIQSVDNYVNVYFKDVKSVKTQMLRSTLTDIANKLAEIPYLFRCHRGYIVNIGQIKVADGNAQGYKLTMNSLNLQVPVSRSNIQQFRELCSETANR